MADSIQDSHQRTVAVLAYFVYTSTATFVATLRSGDKVTKNCQVRMSVDSVDSAVLHLPHHSPHSPHFFYSPYSPHSARSASCRSG